MRAVKYQIKIYDSVLDFTHEFGHKIEEIFIPEKRIAFNIGNGGLNVFKTNKPREKGKQINLDDALANELVNLSELNEKCYKLAQVYFKLK